MRILPTLLLVPALLCGACAGSSSSSNAASSTPAGRAAQQVAAGKSVYVEHCARCHGDAGQGSKKAPPLVGKAALPLDPRPGQKRAGPFHTALDIAGFATKNMPPDESDRAALKAPDYWAVLAFALAANGVKLEQPVGPENAASIVLHP